MTRLAILLSCLLLAGGCAPSFLITPVQNTSQLDEQTVSLGKGWGAGKIAIIEVEGMLMNMRTGGLLQPQENGVSRFTQAMEAAARDPGVKAVVLRVNSPGGTVTASDIMYETVQRFKKETGKPVVASLQDVAASGAYYVACGADRVIAHPTSIVGSIGVIFNTFTIEGTLAKIGAKSEVVKSGPLKDMGSPFRELDPESRKVMQGMVDEYYKRFVGVVTTHRKLNGEGTLKIATDGRVFSGDRAAELGLVDRTGLLDDAIAEAKSLGKVPNAKVIMYRRPFGYTGSIYAQDTTPQPRANVLELSIPGLRDQIPAGFYYLWMP
ncbi:MAG: signal peptide peptidase SppA [Phycisphaerae bacterium]|nr:signal peptide peptidase SppA [Tepidisphaeraceae bacterium]